VDSQTPRLIVTFFQPLEDDHSYLFKKESYSLSGGQSVLPRITSADHYTYQAQRRSLRNRQVVLGLDSEGDDSVYTLSVHGRDIDSFADRRTLRFHLDEERPFDCFEAAPAPAPDPQLVTIDYLAKDYTSFRQALVDFIPTRLADWTERSEADLGIMLLELLAATADELSYMQDRVANEAFLSTATQRRSVADHLALVGYSLDEGAAAYTWLQFQVSGTAPITLPSSPGLRVSTTPQNANDALVVFETMAPATLRAEHNEIAIYTDQNRNCCLPRAALSVALEGRHEFLREGDYVLFDSITTGQRDIVRLSAPPAIIVPTGAGSGAVEVTVLSWSIGTPLRYDYCAADRETVVRGNLVLAVHGETVEDDVDLPAALSDDPSRLRVHLSTPPLAHLDPIALSLMAPVGSVSQVSASARSMSTLQVQIDGLEWHEVPTLLTSNAEDRDFRVEIDDAGDATVVFGDGTRGIRPADGGALKAIYQVGGGDIGNVGPDALVSIRPRNLEEEQLATAITSVTNPLPGGGGRRLESREHARRIGPGSARQLLVAVTPADLEAAAVAFTDSHGQQPVRRARAISRRTGTGLHTLLLVEPTYGGALDSSVRDALVSFIQTRRLAGTDIEITGAQYLPINLVFSILLAAGTRPADVVAEVKRTLGRAELPGGRRGFFHPAEFGFGDPLIVSRLYAAIIGVRGVAAVEIDVLTPIGPTDETQQVLARGSLQVFPGQILRLDNDPSAPANGTLTIRVKDQP
jgi:hypothetical protein